MSAIPTEPDSVYAVILCFGQGDAARQALRETPLYVMQGGQGEHAGGEHAAASSQSHTAPPTPLRYSSSLPSLASGGAMVTDTPLPDGADAEHENAGNDDADEPSLGGSPRSRTTTASLGDTGTPNVSLEHLPLLLAEPAGEPELFAPQINAPAAPFVQDGLELGQNVLGHFGYEEHDDNDNDSDSDSDNDNDVEEEEEEEEEEMEDNDGPVHLDEFLLDLNDGIPDNLPAALEALIGTTTLLQLNELPQHPNRLQLVMALYTALVHYMPLHGLPLDIQPLAIAAAQEQEAPLNDIVDHDGPFEDQDVHAQDDVVDQNAEHGADDEAPAYDAVQAPGPDPAQDADLPALIPGPAEPEVAIANAVLEPAPDVEVMPRTVTRTDAPSVIDTTGTPGREGSTDVRQAHEPVAGASGAPDMPGTWTREGADALLWIYERFSLQGQHRNADAALVQAARRLQWVEQTLGADSTSDEHDPATGVASTSHVPNKWSRRRGLFRSFMDSVKLKSLGQREKPRSRPDLRTSQIPLTK